MLIYFSGVVWVSYKDRSKFMNRLSQVTVTLMYKVVVVTSMFEFCDKVFETLAG